MSGYTAGNDPVALNFKHLAERLSRIESMLESLSNERAVQDFYTTQEVAAILERSNYTVREWCRLGRINASKSLSGRGNTTEWRVSNRELIRLQSEGLLPIPNSSSSDKCQ